MFKEVVDYFGGRIPLALALGVTRQAVSQFERQGYFPANRAIQIEDITQGMFRAKELIRQK